MKSNILYTDIPEYELLSSEKTWYDQTILSKLVPLDKIKIILDEIVRHWMQKGYGQSLFYIQVKSYLRVGKFERAKFWAWKSWKKKGWEIISSSAWWFLFDGFIWFSTGDGAYIGTYFSYWPSFRSHITFFVYHINRFYSHYYYQKIGSYICMSFWIYVYNMTTVLQYHSTVELLRKCDWNKPIEDIFLIHNLAFAYG